MSMTPTSHQVTIVEREIERTISDMRAVTAEIAKLAEMAPEWFEADEQRKLIPQIAQGALSALRTLQEAMPV